MYAGASEWFCCCSCLIEQDLPDQLPLSYSINVECPYCTCIENTGYDSVKECKSHRETGGDFKSYLLAYIVHANEDIAF